MSIQQIIAHNTPLGPRWSYGALGFVSIDGAPGTGSEQTRNALELLRERHTDAAANLLPERVADHLRLTVGTTVLRAIGAAIEDGTAEARAAREAGLRMMQPAQPVDMALAADEWRAFRGMDQAGQAFAIENGDLTRLTALVAHGNRVPLSEPLWAIAVDKYRVENWLVAANLGADNPAQADFAHPLATGVDMDAARAESRALMDQHDARVAAVEANERNVRDLLNFVGAVLGMDPEAVLDAALGRERAAA